LQKPASSDDRILHYTGARLTSSGSASSTGGAWRQFGILKRSPSSGLGLSIIRGNPAFNLGCAVSGEFLVQNAVRAAGFTGFLVVKTAWIVVVKTYLIL